MVEKGSLCAYLVPTPYRPTFSGELKRPPFLESWKDPPFLESWKLLIFCFVILLYFVMFILYFVMFIFVSLCIWQTVLWSLMMFHLRSMFLYKSLSNMLCYIFWKYMCHTKKCRIPLFYIVYNMYQIICIKKSSILLCVC